MRRTNERAPMIMLMMMMMRIGVARSSCRALHLIQIAGRRAWGGKKVHQIPGTRSPITITSRSCALPEYSATTMIWLAGGNQFKIRLPFSWGLPLFLGKSHNNAHTTHGQNSGRKPLTIFNINAVRETAAAVRFVVPRQHFDPSTEQNTHTRHGQRGISRSAQRIHDPTTTATR